MSDTDNASGGGHITEVRTLLMDQLRALRTASADQLPNEIRRARAVTEVAQTVVDSARVEVEYIVAVKGASDSEFLQARDERDGAPRIPGKPQSPLPAVDDPARLGGPRADHPWRGNVTRHRLHG